ncbi:MAG: glycosyltransferase [Scytonema sp. PMC 1069.18]|nr:glycosyltransferase [Scytonema sp. PMC 1069.18]
MSREKLEPEVETKRISLSTQTSEVFSSHIEPISQEVPRPKWSIMIPTYNRTVYLEQTLQSVLQQIPNLDDVQIEVIDNCSTQGEPERLVEKFGKNKISFYRQSYNVGLVGNLNTCIRRARGHLVHILHDDDLVLPGFYSRLEKAFEQEPTIGAAFCHYAHVDENNHQRYLPKLQRNTPGIISNWLEQIAVEQQVQPPAIVVRRSAYEKLGGFNVELTHTTDWEMWKRIAAYYPVWYEPATLAYYREHSTADSRSSIKSGENLVDLRKAIECSKLYLSQPIVDNLSKKASERAALWGLLVARRALSRGDTSTAINQIREALKCSFSMKVIGALSFLPIMAVFGFF